jgi:hypothetical protein
MNLTYSKLIWGFEKWFKANLEELKTLFTAEIAELFESLEDFAVELFAEIHFST